MAIIHSVLGLFIPMYEAICLFVMSKKPYNPGMEPNLPPQTPNFGCDPVPPTMPVPPAASEPPYVNPMQVQGTENLAKDAQSTEAEPTENSAEK